MMLSVNDSLPSFSLPSTSKEKISSDDLLGKNIVIYFYPKDSTPGCTIEANDFSNKIDQFQNVNTIVLGVSKDSIKSHLNFITKQRIVFDLISDSEAELCEKFGVWKEKSMFGKKYMGIERSTFLIDTKGVVKKIWHKVKISGHVDQVLLEAKNLFQLNRNEG
ncbi:MAG: thioredoxin-dependent thiol peroxidase [Candidatus Midichloriaceae bacterium]